MQKMIAHNGEPTIRDLDLSELDAVSGGWSIGTTGDGGLRVDAGGRSLTVWSDGAAYWNGSSVRFFRW